MLKNYESSTEIALATMTGHFKIISGRKNGCLAEYTGKQLDIFLTPESNYEEIFKLNQF